MASLLHHWKFLVRSHITRTAAGYPLESEARLNAAIIDRCDEDDVRTRPVGLLGEHLKKIDYRCTHQTGNPVQVRTNAQSDHHHGHPQKGGGTSAGGAQAFDRLRPRQKVRKSTLNLANCALSQINRGLNRFIDLSCQRNMLICRLNFEQNVSLSS